MPLDTETIDLVDERDRLDARLDELADRVANDEDAEDAAEEAQKIESQYLPGVAWALSRWDETEITIGALNAGEMYRVEDIASDISREKQLFNGKSGSVNGAVTTVFVAAGVVDAPFVPNENGQPDNNVETLMPIVSTELHPQFTAWLEDRIDDLTSFDPGNVTPFVERVAAKTSTDESASNSPEQS